MSRVTDSPVSTVADRPLGWLLIPAMLTALMTYISQHSNTATIQRSMSIYIAATIFGGFIGRALSGLFASWLGWQSSFILLAISLGIGFLLLYPLMGHASWHVYRELVDASELPSYTD